MSTTHTLCFNSFTSFTPDATFLMTLPFPWWRLLTPCLFCSDLGLFILSIHNYLSTADHLHAYNTWLHYPKVRYHVIYLFNKQNKTLGQPSKIQNGCLMYSTHCIFGFKPGVLSIILTNNDVMHAILVHVLNNLFMKGLWDLNE